MSALCGWASAATPAGTIIRNQALASYTDTDGNRVSVASNIVETLIEQVAGLQVTSNQQQRATPGSRISFSHRIQNTGNEIDRYLIGAGNAGGSIDLLNIEVFADANADGVADSANSISVTPGVAAGDDFFVVITASIATGAIDGDTAQLLLDVISEFDTAVTGQNLDTVTVGTGPAITVVKSISPGSGLSPSGSHTITLTYENTGDAAAGDVALIDALPDGMSYVPGSARWSHSGAALSDADPDDLQAGMFGSVRFCAYHTSCVGLPEAQGDADTTSLNQLTAIFDLVDAGQRGSISFQVNIDAGLPTGSLANTAEFEYDIAVGTISRQFSNTVLFEVLADAGVVANGSTSNAINGLNEPVSLVSVGQGGVVVFDNIIWNTGNATDTFNIEVQAAQSTFPPGTLWQLLRDGGSSALTDTNGDGLVDTGPIPPGSFVTVGLRLQLPAGVAGNNSGLGFDLVKIARSVTDAGIADSVLDHLDEIVANVVDLTNQAPAGSSGALGQGPGPEASPVSVVTVDAEHIARFDLYIRHQGSRTDTYQLGASGTAAGSALPTGWQVQFLDPADNSVITSTGVLASGMSRHVRAEIQVPADEPAGTHSVWFKAYSASTGTSDVKHDGIVVIAADSLSIEPSLSAQLEPGGSVVYEHLLINNGNTRIDDITLGLDESRPDWSSVLYLDTNADGTLGPGDLPYDSPLSLLPGESVDVFVKVFAPADAATLQRNVTTVSARWNGDADLVQIQDQSTVNDSRVAIRKEQALDNGCDGQPDDPAGFGPDQIEVTPGNNCVVYRLTATNLGLEPAYNVTIHDYTPAYTRYRPIAVCSRTPCWVQEPAQEDVGIISAETDQLLPGDS
ncbi:MAG: DUF11 domain-containing protein, partial [Granulosicoccus sp.]|nr:DUF11 domain-containing protein [Granulosicoccus sp.]